MAYNFWHVLQRPVVYIWRRGEDFLYVGKTVNLITRWKNHHILSEDGGEIQDLPVDGDVIEIHICTTNEDALELESAIIWKFKPKYNKQIPLRAIRGVLDLDKAIEESQEDIKQINIETIKRINQQLAEKNAAAKAERNKEIVGQVESDRREAQHYISLGLTDNMKDALDIVWYKRRNR